MGLSKNSTLKGGMPMIAKTLTKYEWTIKKSIVKLLTFSVWSEEKLKKCRIHRYLKGVFYLWAFLSVLLATIVFSSSVLTAYIKMQLTHVTNNLSAFIYGFEFSVGSCIAFSILFFIISHNMIKHDIEVISIEQVRAIRLKKFKIPLTNP